MFHSRRRPSPRLHGLQRLLGRHAPQRHQQRERRRHQHNRHLELGRVEHPLLHESENVVTSGVAGTVRDTRARSRNILQQMRHGRHGGVHRTQHKRNENECDGDHHPPNLPPALVLRRDCSVDAVSNGTHQINNGPDAARTKLSRGDDEQQHRHFAQRLQGCDGSGKLDLYLTGVEVVRAVAGAVEKT